jgi:hypothetical protein
MIEKEEKARSGINYSGLNQAPIFCGLRPFATRSLSVPLDDADKINQYEFTLNRRRRRRRQRRRREEKEQKREDCNKAAEKADKDDSKGQRGQSKITHSIKIK